MKIDTLATGGVAVGPVVPATNTPDGVSNFSMTNCGDGIWAPTNVRVSALMGVFLGAGDPTGGLTPAQLSFASGINFASLTPGLSQTGPRSGALGRAGLSLHA